MTTADYCTDPSAISDEDIIAFALGDERPQTLQHLAGCTHCRNEAQSYQELGRQLLKGAHPASIKLSELAMHMLNAQEELVTQAHVRGCSSCQAETASLRDFLTESGDPVTAQGIRAALRRIIARPQASSEPSFAGLRGGAAEESTTYEAEDQVFVIGVQRRMPGRAGRDVTGLQLPPSAPGANAALYDESGRLLQSQDVDELGSFLFSAVREGKYHVEVTSETLTVVIEPLEVT